MTPVGLKEKLLAEIRRLITQKNVDTFLVGEKGHYEQDAYQVVVGLQQTEFPKIRIILVISNMNELHNHSKSMDDFVYPLKAELGYKRWCIVHRNRYIIENTDFIIAYNQYKGRAYDFCQQAKRNGVAIIELMEK